jgi:ribosomal protein S18 acetylase RimI-like enzyme
MIEQATRDDVNEVLPLLLAAIGTIAHSLAGTEEREEASAILRDFYGQEHNRLSYRHVLLYRSGGEIAGMLLSYPGDEAAELDRPLAERPGRSAAAGDITPEARPGEYYLDSLAVGAAFQGQGIAKALIHAFEQRGLKAGYNQLALIVEQGNDRAYSLYTRLGYTHDGELEVSGSRYLRMIKQMVGDIWYKKGK